MRTRHRVSLAVLAAVALGFGAWRVMGGTQAGGLGHLILNTPAGAVWMWGNNSDGQLGDNTLTSRRYPGSVAGMGTITAVASGSAHALALDSTGSVWVWGDNAYGQLGDGTTTDRKLPYQLALTSVVKIAAGGQHSLALRSSGELYVWGRNTNGQLGLGNTTQQTSPVLLMSGISDMAGGASHSAMVKTDGTAWAFGYNFNGQLGNGNTTQSTSPVQMTGITAASAVAAGSAHTLVLRTDNTLRATGLNFYGQLGDSSNTQRTSAVTVTGLSTVVEIAAGDNHSVARLADGTVRAWGYNSTGAVGDGTGAGRNAPVTVSGLSSIAGIGAGSNVGLAVSTTGVVYVWGSNAYGEQGDGTINTNALAPHAISGANYDWKVATPTLNVASGTYFTNQTVTVQNVMSGPLDFEMHYTTSGAEPTQADSAIINNGTIDVLDSRTVKVKAWKGTMPASDTATRVYTLQATQPTATPSGGVNLTTTQNVVLATTTPGATVRYTTNGSTPTVVSTAYSTPIPISTGTTVKAIAFKSGWSDSTMLTASYAFNYGTLAAPTVTPAAGAYTTSVAVTMSSAQPGAEVRYTTNNTAPTAASTLYTGPLTLTATTTVRAKAFHADYAASAETSRAYEVVTAAPTFSLAPGSYPAGTSVTVSTATPGATINYTLDGSEPLVTHPTIASGGSLVVGNFTLKAKAWGSGQTSSPTATAAYTVTGTSAVPAIGGGNYHSVALRGDGTLFAWGLNSGRELADGTTTLRLLPVPVGGLTGVTAVSVGSNFALARLADGRVAGWGSATSGHLGNGSTTTPTWPVFATGITTAASIDAGMGHALAVLADGTVRGWGANPNGQVGDGTSGTDRTTPVVVSGLSSVASVSAGDYHSLAVKTDGTAWSWGGNGNGQLGTGNTTSRTSAGAVLSITGVSAVAAGGSTSYFLLSDGTVRSVGLHNNGFTITGMLGDGSVVGQSLTPVTVLGLSGVLQIAAGQNHAIALKSDQTVWTWGDNGNGQLGTGTTTDSSVPVLVAGLPPIAAVGAGQTTSFAIGTDGSVWAWGVNAQGQVGDASTTNRLLPVQIAAAGMGWQMQAPVLSVAAGTYFANQSVTVSHVDTAGVLGGLTTVRFTTDGSDPTPSTGTAVTWNGSAWLPTVTVDQSRTVKAKAWRTGYLASNTTTALYELKVVTPSATPGTGAYGTAQNVTLSTTTSGATIRYTTDATEPTASSSAYSAPVAVASTLTLRARGFKTGWLPSDSVTPSYWISGGTVAAPTATPAAGTFTSAPLVTLASATSGASIRYTLDGSDPSATSPLYRYPFVVGATTTVKARAFKTGMTQSAVTTAAYAVDAAGATATPTISPMGGVFTTRRTVTVTGPVGSTMRYTTNGADPTTSDTQVPVNGQIIVDRAQVLKVRAWATGLTVSAVRRADFVITGAISAGQHHTLVLKEDGTVWAFGLNANGQVGNNSIIDALSPVQVLTGAVAIAAGYQHSLAVKADGTVWSWGRNDASQLGRTGTTTVPAQMTGITNAVAVAGGTNHSLILKSDGTVWAVGANANGQIGDASTTARTTAVQVLGLTGATAVAAGDQTSAAIQTDSSGSGWVYTWGQNAVGQLGDGSRVNRATPVRVPLPTPALDVSVGAEIMAARRSDLLLAPWGNNPVGQLGIGTTTASSTPGAITGLPGVRQFAAGREHMLAQDSQGRVWGWGSNGTGRLGAGDSLGFGLTYASTPYVTQFPAVLALAAGAEHSAVIAADGRVLAAGLGQYGQLGNGGTSIQSLPVQAGTLLAASNAALVADPDGDGLTTWREYLLGTDPLAKDSNGNGIDDAVEAGAGLNDPGNPDSDNDGLANWLEVAAGLNPFAADSDGDGVTDGADYYPLDSTRWLAPTPTPGDTTPPVITLMYPAGARPVP